MSRIIFLYFSIVFIGGCSSSFNTSYVIVGETRAAISPTDVKIYITPPEKYEEIAIIDGTNAGSVNFSEQSKADYIVGNLKEYAAKLGANGIILHQFSDQVTNVPITTYNAEGQATVINASDKLKKGRGIAIYVEH